MESLNDSKDVGVKVIGDIGDTFSGKPPTGDTQNQKNQQDGGTANTQPWEAPTPSPPYHANTPVLVKPKDLYVTEQYSPTPLLYKQSAPTPHKLAAPTPNITTLAITDGSDENEYRESLEPTVVLHDANNRLVAQNEFLRSEVAEKDKSIRRLRAKLRNIVDTL